jgi:hypothetical protein
MCSRIKPNPALASSESGILVRTENLKRPRRCKTSTPPVVFHLEHLIDDRPGDNSYNCQQNPAASNYSAYINIHTPDIKI